MKLTTLAQRLGTDIKDLDILSNAKNLTIMLRGDEVGARNLALGIHNIRDLTHERNYKLLDLSAQHQVNGSPNAYNFIKTQMDQATGGTAVLLGLDKSDANSLTALEFYLEQRATGIKSPSVVISVVPPGYIASGNLHFRLNTLTYDLSNYAGKNPLTEISRQALTNLLFQSPHQ